jgi:hypothetical protein
MEITFVKKNDEDAKLILEWRNDKITRQNSFNQEIQKWENFKEIFYNKYFDNYLPPLFAIFNNKKIAFILFTKINDKEFNISINVSPEER